MNGLVDFASQLSSGWGIQVDLESLWRGFN